MTWFNIPGWGDYNLNGLAEKQLVALGAHGYATQAQADAHPNAAPSPAQEALLQEFNVSSLSPVGAGATQGVLQTPHSTGGVSGAATNIAGNVASAFTLNASGDWRRFALRAVEVAIGGLLIIVAANHLATGQSVATTIKKIGKTGVEAGGAFL